MAENKGGESDTPKKLSSKLTHLSPYEIVNDWAIGRAEEVEGNRTEPVNPWGIVEDKKLDLSELTASPEEAELLAFHKRVEGIFRQVGFTDQELSGDDSVQKSVSVPKGGVLWFEIRPANPDKWLPGQDTMEIFEVREELEGSRLRRIAGAIVPDLRRIEHEIFEVGPFGQARYERTLPKDPSVRVKNENEAIRIARAEVVGNTRSNIDLLVSSGKKFLDRVTKIVSPPSSKRN